MAAPFHAQEVSCRPLQGRRVRFRELQDSDLPDLVRWWQNPETAAFQDYTVTPRPGEKIAEMFKAWSANDHTGNVGFSVIDVHTETLLGHAVLHGASLPARSATLAVIIGAEHVDQGYGTDAVRLLTDFGFREMGLNRIELRVFSFNDRARAVYQKVGYREEGTRREVAFHCGVFWDEVIMSILAREWFSLTPRH